MLTVEHTQDHDSSLVDGIAAVSDGLLLRAALLSVMSTYVSIALSEGARIHNWIMNNGTGNIVVYCMTLFLLIALWFDWLINDVMPDRFVWKGALQRRPYLYYAGGVSFLVWSFAVLATDVPGAIAWQYLVLGLVSMFLGLKMAVGHRKRLQNVRQNL